MPSGKGGRGKGPGSHAGKGKEAKSSREAQAAGHCRSTEHGDALSPALVPTGGAGRESDQPAYFVQDSGFLGNNFSTQTRGVLGKKAGRLDVLPLCGYLPTELRAVWLFVLFFFLATEECVEDGI